MLGLLKKIVSALLIWSLLLSTSFAAKAEIEARSQNPKKTVKHIYIEEGVENVILICDKYEFRKEFEDFKDYRKKYFLLWTGIVTALVIYAYSR